MWAALLLFRPLSPFLVFHPTRLPRSDNIFAIAKKKKKKSKPKKKSLVECTSRSARLFVDSPNAVTSTGNSRPCRYSKRQCRPRRGGLIISSTFFRESFYQQSPFQRPSEASSQLFLNILPRFYLDSMSARQNASHSSPVSDLATAIVE